MLGGIFYIPEIVSYISLAFLLHHQAFVYFSVSSSLIIAKVLQKPHNVHSVYNKDSEKWTQDTELRKFVPSSPPY